MCTKPILQGQIELSLFKKGQNINIQNEIADRAPPLAQSKIFSANRRSPALLLLCRRRRGRLHRSKWRRC